MTLHLMSRLISLYKNHALVRVLLAPLAVARRMLGINNASKQAVRDAHQQIIIRNLQDLLTEDPVLKVSEFGGCFRMNVTSHLFVRIVRDRGYEPEISNLVDQFLPKDRDVIDVGANIGFFSVKFAKLTSGKVLAVEPTDNAQLRLRDNLARNGVAGRVIVFPGVATDHDGTEEITFIDGREEYSTLGVLAHPSVAGEVRQFQQVNAATLDALVAKHELSPGFMKIDVEGMEHLVLGGAAGILRNHRPIVLCEICDPLLRNNHSSAEKVIGMIRNASYDVFDAENPDRPAGSDPYGNVICFPKETMISREALKTAITNNQAATRQS